MLHYFILCFVGQIFKWATVGQNEVWVKKNISLIKPTPFERSGQYLSETVDEKIRTWQLFEKSAKMWFLCMSNFFFKQKATVAKPMDFDDFYRFVLTNHDLFMVRKWILTLSIQKKHGQNTFWKIRKSRKNPKFREKNIKVSFRL